MSVLWMRPYLISHPPKKKIFSFDILSQTSESVSLTSFPPRRTFHHSFHSQLVDLILSAAEVH